MRLKQRFFRRQSLQLECKVSEKLNGKAIHKTIDHLRNARRSENVKETHLKQRFIEDMQNAYR